MHWSNKKKFKDLMRSKTMYASNGLALKSGWNLDFTFYFMGRKLDSVNIFHYVKVIEDTIFIEDSKNKRISVETFKAKENYIEVTIWKQ